MPFKPFVTGSSPVASITSSVAQLVEQRI